MKHILLLLFLLPLFSIGQAKKISLEEAILLSQKKSPDYQAAVNKFRSSYWKYRNYKSSFLPQVSLSATIPSYSEEIKPIEQDNGTQNFQNISRLNTDLRLNVSQNVSFTGGTLSLSSNINRIRNFGDSESTSYFYTPYSIRYSQNSIFYNRFKWDKKIEPLLNEEAKRNFIEAMENISLKSCNQYFTLLKLQIQAKIAKTNFANSDTLYKIAQGRFHSGKIAENDLLRMELQYLNAKNNVTNNSISLKKASQNLALFLGFETENLELEIPQNLELFDVKLSKALKEAKSNRKSVIQFRRQRLQAEKELARVKGTNKINLTLDANFGRSSRSSTGIDAVFDNYTKQQGVVLSMRIPIIDWGLSKSARKIAEANLDLTNTNINQDKRNFEQEIELHVLNWSNQRNLLSISKKAQEIAIKSYEITKNRYLLGKIEITDLNISLQEKDKAIVTYLNSLERFWSDYYTLRKLTLFDFRTNKKIKAEDLLFD
ncbi:TolC family protein [Flavicella sediminum]|uniref:TolC family protein n=1 Tax=Flavicella sediminum TaxID=2585141 RepID=UPI00111F31D2|nr:TolC family protein [Flavicella sediminum]